MKRFPFAPRLTWRCLTAVLALVATCQSVWAANLIGSYDLAAGSYANSISGSGSLGSLSPISTSGNIKWSFPNLELSNTPTHPLAFLSARV